METPAGLSQISAKVKEEPLEMCRRIVLFFLLFSLLGFAATNTPTIAGVTNAADSSTRFSPGCDAAIYGSNFSSASTVTVGGLSAPVLYASASITIQIPSGLSLGLANIVVTVPGVGSSTPFTITLNAFAPAFFQGAQSGGLVPVLQHTDGSIVSVSNPAAPSETLMGYMTGLGRTNPPVPDGTTPGAPAPTVNPVTATIKGEPAQVLFAGLPTVGVGVDQVNFRVPADIPTGTWPLVVSVGGFSATAQISVARERYSISTAAGVLPPLNVQASATILAAVEGMAMDQNNNLFLAEVDGHTVKKIATTTGILSLVAGNRVSVDSGDGSLATNASLAVPRYTAVDSSGNVYVSERESCVIRKIAAATKIITTVAGVNGQCGYNGDNIAANTAQLNYPRGIAVDPSGNLYIADVSNARVRKMDTSGKITTFAGTGTGGFSGDSGIAASATLRSPRDVAADSLGNIYIADYGNSRIREVDAATLHIKTVVGTGQTAFNNDNLPGTSTNIASVQCLTVDTAGNLYWTDSGQNRVRSLNKTKQTVVTIAGNGAAGYSGDNGPATSATFASLEGVAVDTSFNVYIADFGTMVIRKVTPGSPGTITTYAGSAGPNNAVPTAAFLNGPLGLGFDGGGNLYVTDGLDYRVRKINAAFTQTSTVAGLANTPGYTGDNGPAAAATLNAPGGLTADAVGNIYFSDSIDCVVRGVSAGSNLIRTMVGTGTCGYNSDSIQAGAAQLNGPNGLAVNALGTTGYIADTTTTASGRFRFRPASSRPSPATERPADSPDGTVAAGSPINAPYDVKVAANGDVYFAEQGNALGSQDLRGWQAAYGRRERNPRIQWRWRPGDQRASEPLGHRPGCEQ